MDDVDIDDDEEDLEISATVATLVRKGQSGGGQEVSSAATIDRTIGKRRGQVEGTFRRRVGRCPGQVLRYAYGGSPLWCTFPYPDFSASSDASLICQQCGSERVFEMQLMPGLLDYLPAIVTSPSSSTTGPSVDIKQYVENGLDFGVVTVWSCPLSCGQAGMEAVIVQPSSDSVL